MRIKILMSMLTVAVVDMAAQTLEPIKYGDFSQWVTRYITESKVIGGAVRTVYEVGPTQTSYGAVAYTPQGGSPWGTSNVYARVKGVTKCSNAVSPYDRGNGNVCAMLSSKLEQVKVLGLINMDVMVAGSMFLGVLNEPVTSTANPNSNIDMGVTYTKRPSALVFDYRVDMPEADTRIKATGFGGKKVLPGRDSAVVFVFLQRRWEDADGRIYARRVATGGEMFSDGCGWVSDHVVPLRYGDASSLGSWLGLRRGSTAYYARNSRGKMVAVEEEDWDDPLATPTHVIMMFSAGSGEAYIGTLGLTLYVDNVSFRFDNDD